MRAGKGLLHVAGLLRSVTTAAAGRRMKQFIIKREDQSKTTWDVVKSRPVFRPDVKYGIGPKGGNGARRGGRGDVEGDYPWGAEVLRKNWTEATRDVRACEAARRA